MSKYDLGLGKRSANHVPLSPLSFLRRTAEVFPERAAVRYMGQTQSWISTYQRCIRLADALRERGIGSGDTVSVLCPNTPPAVEVAFGVPMSGAVLHMINTRLDASAIAFMLDHAEAKVFLVDQGLSEVGQEAVTLAGVSPTVVDIEDLTLGNLTPIGELTYEELIGEGAPEAEWSLPGEEWDAIALNYTSGTTGDPKGVVYHHRGAFLNAVGNALEWALPHHPTYLWTLPLFQ